MANKISTDKKSQNNPTWSLLQLNISSIFYFRRDENRVRHKTHSALALHYY